MIVIDREKCIGCGLCASDCVTCGITVENGKAALTGACLGCGHCAAICPKAAVALSEADAEDGIEASACELDPEVFLRAVKLRRSIRAYQAKPIERETLLKLAEVGRYTATAANRQGNRFVFVQDELQAFKDAAWTLIDENADAPSMKPYLSFNERRKVDPKDDFLFRNAPAVLFVVTDNVWDAGLAAQNIEMMAVACGLGALYNGYLTGLVNNNESLKRFLGIGGATVSACMLLGYPAVKYARSAPRKPAQVILK